MAMMYVGNGVSVPTTATKTTSTTTRTPGAATSQPSFAKAPVKTTSTTTRTPGSATSQPSFALSRASQLAAAASSSGSSSGSSSKNSSGSPDDRASGRASGGAGLDAFGGGYEPFVQPTRVGTPAPPGLYPGSEAYNRWQEQLLQSGGVPQRHTGPTKVPPMAAKDEYAAGGKYADRNWYLDTLGYMGSETINAAGDLAGLPIDLLNNLATPVQRAMGVADADTSLFFGGGKDIKNLLRGNGLIKELRARDPYQAALGGLTYTAAGLLPLPFGGARAAVAAGEAVAARSASDGLSEALAKASLRPADNLLDEGLVQSAAQRNDDALLALSTRENNARISANMAREAAARSAAGATRGRMATRAEEGMLGQAPRPLDAAFNELNRYSLPARQTLPPGGNAVQDALYERMAMNAEGDNNAQIIANAANENEARRLFQNMDETDALVAQSIKAEQLKAQAMVREGNPFGAKGTGADLSSTVGVQGALRFPYQDMVLGAGRSDQGLTQLLAARQAENRMLSGAADVMEGVAREPAIPRKALPLGEGPLRQLADPARKWDLPFMTGAGVGMTGLAGWGLTQLGATNNTGAPATVPASDTAPAVSAGGLDVVVPATPAAPAVSDAEAQRYREQMALAREIAAGKQVVADTPVAASGGTDVAGLTTPIESSPAELFGDSSVPGVAGDPEPAPVRTDWPAEGTGISTNDAIRAGRGSNGGGEPWSPPPGTRLSTNGRYYSQNADGSWKEEGKVPGYTAAQLDKAANAGAFRDPNNVTTRPEPARAAKKAKKEDEKSFFDTLADLGGEMAGHSLLGRFANAMFPDLGASVSGWAHGLDDNWGIGTPPDHTDDPDWWRGSAANRDSRGGNGGRPWRPGRPGTPVPPTPAPPMPPMIYQQARFPQMPPYDPGRDNEWRYFANGGLVQGYADGGGVNYNQRNPLPPTAGLDPRLGLIADAEDALSGDLPDPEPVLTAFVEQFGPAALDRLKEQVSKGMRMRGDNARLVRGPGGPTDDAIPARINGSQEARLSDGEFVMTADAVRNAGDGDAKAGADRLMQLNEMLSKGRGSGQKAPVEVYE